MDLKQCDSRLADIMGSANRRERSFGINDLPKTRDVDVLHHDVVQPVVHTDSECTSNIRMRHSGKALRLALESLTPNCLSSPRRRQHFERTHSLRADIL